MSTCLEETWIKANSPEGKWHWHSKGVTRVAACGHDARAKCGGTRVFIPDKDVCPDCQYFHQRGIRRKAWREKWSRRLIRMAILAIVPGMVLGGALSDHLTGVERRGWEYLVATVICVTHVIAWVTVFCYEDKSHV